jgi:cytohesin
MARDRDVEDDLLAAIRSGDADEVRRLIANGAGSCLHLASYEHRDFDDESPLHLAVELGNAAVVKELIDAPHGADASERESESQRTPLHIAVESCGTPHAGRVHAKVVRVLLDAGADTAAMDGYERTPLQIATEAGDHEVVSMLLGAGAKTSVTSISDDDNYTPLHLATARDFPKVVKMLLDARADTEARDRDERTPLYIAIQDEDAASTLQMVKMLLDAGAKTKTTNRADNRYTPLHIASERGDDELVEMLLGAGANVAATDDSYNTPLHLACTGTGHGLAGVVGVLLDARADVAATNGDEQTPLHLAAREGAAEVVRKPYTLHPKP